MSMMRDLAKAIASLPNSLETESPAIKTIKIVSLDVNHDAVQAEIEKLKSMSNRVKEYFDQREHHRGNDENDKCHSRFITSVHCTFAHASEVPQASMIASFQHVLGSSLDVEATALLFSDKVAAIELRVPHHDSIPAPKNSFPHMTVWCSEGTEAYQSNQLPEEVNCGKAERVAFGEPVPLRGTFSFWYY